MGQQTGFVPLGAYPRSRRGLEVQGIQRETGAFHVRVDHAIILVHDKHFSIQFRSDIYHHCNPMVDLGKYCHDGTWLGTRNCS